MALSKDDRQRIVELSKGGKRKRRDDNDEGELRLAGSAAAPLPPGSLPRRQRRAALSGLFYRARPVLLFGLIPLLMLAAGAAYSVRYDLHRMDVGAVFDSRRGGNLRYRFMEQVNLQKRKRALLDEGYGHSFANNHIAAVANADQVLALEPTNAEALELRRTALSRQVVFAAGALQAGDTDTAIRRVQQVLAADPGNTAAAAFLQKCAETLVDDARDAFDTKDYRAAGEFVAKAEAIAPHHAGARDLHRRLVQYHVKAADEYYLKGEYVRALEHVEMVRRLEEHNPRVNALFDKIDERVGFPDIQVNSILTLAGTSRVMVTIDNRAVQLMEGDVHQNVRCVRIDQSNGVVAFEQIYTGEQQEIVRPRGGRGRTFITPSRTAASRPTS